MGHTLGCQPPTVLEPSLGTSLQVIVYVEDVNDEAPVFTQQQYNRLGLRETAGIGTSVIVVRATDRDTGKAGRGAISQSDPPTAAQGALSSVDPPCSHTQAQEGFLGWYSLFTDAQAQEDWSLGS